MQDIKILKIRRINGEGRSLKGFVDIQIGDFTINNWRVFHKNGERISVAVPQTTWKDKEGVMRYQHIIAVPEELKQRIDVAILGAWEKELNGEKGKKE